MRLSLWLVALSVLVMMATALPAPARAEETPCPEGTTAGRVHLTNAVATVPYANRTHTITVQMAGLDHRGIVGYDDNLNGVPERCEESNGLGAFELNLTFNPAVVTVEDGVEGDDLASSGGTRRFQCQDRRDDDSHYSFGCFSTGDGAGPQGSFDLATITLRLVGGGPAALALEASLAGPLGDDADVELQGGSSITVTGAPVRPTQGPGSGSPTSEDPNETPGGPNGGGTATGPTVASTGVTSGTSETPDGTPTDKTPSPEDGNGSGGSGGSGSGDGASTASVMLWTLAGLAGFGAAGALGFFALRWRGML
jgi:hypothetical protein